MVLRRNRRKLGLHTLPTHIVGARRKDGRVESSCRRIDLRRELIHRIIVNRATASEFDGIAGGPVRLLNGVAEQTSTIGGGVARHLLQEDTIYTVGGEARTFAA